MATTKAIVTTDSKPQENRKLLIKEPEHDGREPLFREATLFGASLGLSVVAKGQRYNRVYVEVVQHDEDSRPKSKTTTFLIALKENHGGAEKGLFLCRTKAEGKSARGGIRLTDEQAGKKLEIGGEIEFGETSKSMKVTIKKIVAVATMPRSAKPGDENLEEPEIIAKFEKQK